ncbi:DUF1592 domain-containing protein [Zavarzinella formosa]|uniref:DUF1592 domain-containing protein n=1 Tax=Zavarzinella formosa TaxID=360055 RepID=UPI0002D792E9|nr:DUF1592 domain-containing protein [Zavarzinella formosa]
MRWHHAIILIPAFLAGIMCVWLIRHFAQHRAVAAPPEVPAVQPKTPAPQKPDPFDTQVRPLLVKYCVTCHSDQKQSAGLSLEPYKDSLSARKARGVWEKVREEVDSKQMPPKNKLMPTDAERKIITAWAETISAKVDCGLVRDPGRPTIRRLNRVEYNNTVRDLLGVDVKPADDFPSDDVGYGFDNIGDVLSMPPILLEKYLTAAEKVLDAAIVIPKPIVSGKEVFKPQNVRSTLGAASKQKNRVALVSNGSAIVSYDFIHTGDYLFRCRAYGEQAGTELPKLSIDIGKSNSKSFDVDALENKAKTYEFRTRVTAGKHDVSFSFTNDFLDKDNKKDRNLYIEQMEIEGPINPVAKPLPDSHKKIFSTLPKTPAERETVARQILTAFTTKAYRRPVKADEITRLMKLFQFVNSPGEPFEQAVRHAMKAVLVSPHFLFRIEQDSQPNNPEAIHPVSDFEFATRLSYFLWSTMPDDELFGLARSGELRKPGVTEAQIKRMLKDPKATALVENFAGQWLMLRTLATLAPDRKTYRTYDNALRDSMVKETELYFAHIMREDRSVLELLDSDYTFVDERLAKHYGLSNVKGSEFRQVKLTDRNRGGVLTQASVLTVTSNPTRTSPVKRGKWILENILGTPPPPPPPDVPELDDAKKGPLTGSLRQRMEKHRENASCATCHAKMDPLGFGLENFDGVGSFRTFDGDFKVDPSGVLPDGAKFSGSADLKKVLLGKSDQFRRNLSDRMLTYAIGRGLEYYDTCALDDIVKGMKGNGDRFSSLVMGVVNSDAFQKRRGSLQPNK